MVAEGQHVLLQAWWVATIPGLVIVVARRRGCSMIGDGLCATASAGSTGSRS